MSRAVRFTRYGGPEVLEVVEVDAPHAGAGQVRVAVRAAGANPFDSKVRRGEVPNLTPPRGQGSEFAGVVDELGDGVTTLALGDEVLGWASGCQADFVLARATSVAPKPIRTGLGDGRRTRSRRQHRAARVRGGETRTGGHGAGQRRDRRRRPAQRAARPARRRHGDRHGPSSAP